MAYDVESDRVILFGGETNPDSGVLGDIWAYDLSANAWSKMAPAQSPRDGTGGALAYDIQSDRVIMFAGSRFFGAKETPPAESASETWAYDFNTDTWEKMEPAEAPFGLVGESMVYDVESDRMILFGGLDLEVFLSGGGEKSLNDTWAYDFDSDTWTEMEPAVSPPGRNQHTMAYDDSSDRVILFGGGFEDMWSYDYNTDTWEELHPGGMPSDRFYSNLIYDTGSERMILFGGASAFRERPLSDTWAYDFDSDAWTELEPGTHPSARGWYGAVYSTAAGKVILFGGGSDRDTFTDETWIYDPETNRWTDVTSSP